MLQNLLNLKLCTIHKKVIRKGDLVNLFLRICKYAKGEPVFSTISILMDIS